MKSANNNFCQTSLSLFAGIKIKKAVLQQILKHKTNKILSFEAEKSTKIFLQKNIFVPRGTIIMNCEKALKL
jgi:hypothetical protein